MNEVSKGSAASLRIYGGYRSRTSRVYWTADELGLDFDSVHVTLALSHPEEVLDGALTTCSPEFLTINPLGLVPVIDDGGLIVRQSLAITYYLARKYGGDLAPQSLEEEALVLGWLFWVATEVENSAVELLVTLAQGTELDVATLGRIVEKLKPQFKFLNDHLAGRDYVMGERFTVADLNIAEVFRLTQGQDALFDQFRNVRAWIRRCQSRPSFVRMMAGRQRELT